MKKQTVERFQRIKVIDIELSQPVKSLTELDGYVAVKGLVRLHGEPLGYIQLGIANGCCRAEEIGKAILERYGWSIIRHLISDVLSTPLRQANLDLATLCSASHPIPDGPSPWVTVAVCTRNRSSDLAICLDALQQLDYPALDILVVDNAPSSDETKQLVLTKYPNIRYIQEPRPGLSWARNRAVLESQGEILAFTDDDVVVDPGWVRALAQSFVENPDAMAVTGLVVPYELETEPQILFEVHGGFGRGFHQQSYKFSTKEERAGMQYHGAGKFGTGANMAFRRCLFDYIGNFDTALGVGTVTNGGEDIEMFFRLLHTGYLLMYEPKALVRHRHRRDYASLYRQLCSNATGLAAFHMRSALAYPDQRIKFIKLHCWWLLHWHLKRLFQALTRPHRFPRELIWGELRGYITGVFRYRRAQHHAADIVNQFGLLNSHSHHG